MTGSSIYEDKSRDSFWERRARQRDEQQELEKKAKQRRGSAFHRYCRYPEWSYQTLRTARRSREGSSLLLRVLRSTPARPIKGSGSGAD